MTDMTTEPGPALPRGFCRACLKRFQGRVVPTADGGRLVAGLCEHNRVGAVIQHLPTGETTKWRMQTPCTEEELREWVALLAGAVHGIVDSAAQELADRPPGPLN